MRRAKAFIAFTVVLGGFLFSSCEKYAIDEPYSNNPVFKAKGTVDGVDFNIVAGDDNAYMFTSIENENGISIFSGNLSDGDFAIEMGIYDGLIDMPDHEPINSLPNTFVYSRLSTTPLAILTKEAFPNVDLIQSVSWFIDGAFQGNDSVVIYEPGVYNVCADIVFSSDQSSAQLCSELVLGYQRHANCNIKHFLSPNGRLTAWVEDPQVEVEKVEWYLDNALISENPEFVYQNFPTGNHVLRAQVNFVNGVKRSKSMILDGDLTGKFIQDLTFFETSISTLLNRDFNVRIKLLQDGVTYRSDITNNSSNSISFSDITYYGKDSSGNPVYKVKAHVIATVKDEQNVNGTRELEFDTTFGIAFPEE